MSDDRWVVLGLAHPRAGWFTELARWATTAAIPVDFVKCVSADEVRARLTSGRSYSALMVGGAVTGLDRDLVDNTRTVGAAVVVVDPVADRDWAELGVDSLLPANFDRADLMAVLSEHAPPIKRVAQQMEPASADVEPTWRGRLIAITGAGGTGCSVVSMALAQALGGDSSNHGLIALADFALHGDLSMLHDAREVVPGVQELAEAHRAGRLPIEDIRSMMFQPAGRGYHLLLGLRRHRDWTAIRARAFDAAVDGLLRSYRLLVADVDPDVEGESETGSLDVQDRNLMSRTTMARADLVVVVGHPSPKGMHAMSRTIRGLHEFGLDGDRIIPVLNHSPWAPHRRAGATRALAVLTRRHDEVTPDGSPVFLPERHDLDSAIHDGVPLPSGFGLPLYEEISRRLDEVANRRPSIWDELPVAVVPGSLGTWTEEAG